MKIAYFDCFSGVSGDMLLGALIDAGLDLAELESELGKLKISGYEIKAERTSRNEISATKFSINMSEPPTRRNLGDITEIIDHSDLGDDIKASSQKIFTELATAEARIHNKDIQEIHFHEVGALDSILDVIGCLIGIKRLGIGVVYSSKVQVGTGFVDCQHGTLPVPAPATVELLKGIPVYSKGIEAELTTPTGAAILKAMSRSFGNMPKMKVEKIGYGAGNRELEIPNLRRVYIGETMDAEYEEEEVVLVETNIDDMNPQIFGYVSELLLEKGCLDVFMTPIFMKKNRPGTMLSILTKAEKLDETLSTLFTETTTLGVRIHRLERKKLARQIVAVKTSFGEIRAKITKIKGQIKNIAPEYEDCREIAVKQGVPLKDIYDEARRAAQETLSEREAD